MSSSRAARFGALSLAVFLFLAPIASTADSDSPRAGTGLFTAGPGSATPTPAEMEKLARLRSGQKIPAPIDPASDPPPEAATRCVIFYMYPETNYDIATDPDYYDYIPVAPWWAVVGLRSAGTGEDWDLTLYDIAGTVDCLEVPLASSLYGSGTVDVVAVDYNHSPLDYDFVQCDRYLGFQNGNLEWEQGQLLLGENEVVWVDADAEEIVEVYEIWMSAGTTYNFMIDVLATGEAQATLLLFENPGTSAYYAGRAQAVLSIDETTGADTYTATRSDWYGLVSVNENGFTGRYKISYGRCESPVVLSPGVAVSGGHGFDWYRADQTASYWAGIALRTESPSRSLAVFGSSSGWGWPWCFGGLNVSVAGGSPGTSFFLGNFNEMATGPFWISTETAFGWAAEVQWHGASQSMSPTSPLVYRTTGPDHLIEVWDAWFTAHQTYNMRFLHSQTADLGLHVFVPIAGLDWYGDSNDYYTTSGGCLPVESPESGWHGVAVVSHDGAVGDYEWGYGFPVVDETPAPLNEVAGGIGLAWVDADADGDEDIFVSAYATLTSNRLFLNDGPDAWVEATPPSLLALTSSTYSRWADIDNDGDADALISGQNAQGDWPLVFRNDGFPSFVDVTPDSMPDPAEAWPADGAWVDLDRDGWLDLVLVVYSAGEQFWIFPGRGPTGFGPPLRVGPSNPSNVSSMSWGDWDGDLDPDLLVAGDGGLDLFRNDGGFAFTEVTSAAFSGTTGLLAEGVSWADWDNDLDLDLYASHATPNTDRLWRNDGGVFVDASAGLPTTSPSRNVTAFADIDNDALPDLHVVPFGESSHRFLNNTGVAFELSTNPAYEIPDEIIGLAYADPDGDGDLDAYAVPNYFGSPGGVAHYLRNDLCPGYHWLQVVLEGVVSNRSALGARVTVHADWLQVRRELTDNSGYLSQGSRILHFGLGNRGPVDSLVVEWPSGIRQVVPGPMLDERILVVEWDLALGGPSVSDTPVTFALHAARPSPFSDRTTLVFDLPRAAGVSLQVFDVTGRLVRTVLDQASIGPGSHAASWDGRDGAGRMVGTGIYFYRLRAGELTETRKLIRVR